MKVINKKTGEDISGLYVKLMRREITNAEFEELTGLEPAENNPSRKDYLNRKKQNV